MELPHTLRRVLGYDFWSFKKRSSVSLQNDSRFMGSYRHKQITRRAMVRTSCPHTPGHSLLDAGCTRGGRHPALSETVQTDITLINVQEDANWLHTNRTTHLFVSCTCFYCMDGCQDLQRRNSTFISASYLLFTDWFVGNNSSLQAFCLFKNIVTGM